MILLGPKLLQVSPRGSYLANLTHLKLSHVPLQSKWQEVAASVDPTPQCQLKYSGKSSYAGNDFRTWTQALAPVWHKSPLP